MDNLQTSFFERQTKLDQIGESGQLKLLKAQVLVIGSGGLGCSVLQSLVHSGVSHITIVDHDSVDVTNLHRQVLFNVNDIGKSKAQTASDKLNKIAPWVSTIAINKKFEGEAYYKEFDIIVDCTDNLRTKFLIHDFAFTNKINLVQASIHKFDGQLQVFKYANSTDKGCLRCLWDEEPIQLGSCSDNGVMGVVPALFGTLQANEVIKLVLGIGEAFENEVLTFNLLNLETSKLKYKKHTECKFCVKKELTMENFEVKPEDINFDDYRWLDIRIMNAGKPLPANLPADLVITKTDEEIMAEFPDLPQDKPFLVLCDKGFRAAGLTKLLREDGNDNVFSLAGGYLGLGV